MAGTIPPTDAIEGTDKPMKRVRFKPTNINQLMPKEAKRADTEIYRRSIDAERRRISTIDEASTISSRTAGQDKDGEGSVHGGDDEEEGPREASLQKQLNTFRSDASNLRRYHLKLAKLDVDIEAKVDHLSNLYHKVGVPFIAITKEGKKH